VAWSDAAREAAAAARQQNFKGKVSGQTLRGRAVSMKFSVKAFDHYGAGDKAKALAERKFGTLFYPVIQHSGGPSTFTMSRGGRAAVRGAGPEES
jgi:hypothetical protein